MNTVDGLHHFAERLAEERRAHEERQRREAEWRAQRDEQLQLIRAEESRVQALLGEVESWHQSQRVRQYIQALVDRFHECYGVEEAGEKLGAWVDWATAQADRIDPLVESPRSVLDQKPRSDRASSPSA